MKDGLEPEEVEVGVLRISEVRPLAVTHSEYIDGLCRQAAKWDRERKEVEFGEEVAN